MSFLERINMRKVRKAILYLFCTLVSVWLQTMVFSRNGLFGVKPMFIPGLIVAIGLFEGGVWGGMLGLAAGFYCDMCYSDSTVLFLILFSVFGFFTGVLADFFINRRFVSYLILTAFMLFVTAAAQGLSLLIFRGASFWALLGVVLLQTLWSLPFAVLYYLLIRRIAGRNRTRPGKA